MIDRIKFHYGICRYDAFCTEEDTKCIQAYLGTDREAYDAIYMFQHELRRKNNLQKHKRINGLVSCRVSLNFRMTGSIGSGKRGLPKTLFSKFSMWNNSEQRCSLWVQTIQRMLSRRMLILCRTNDNIVEKEKIEFITRKKVNIHRDFDKSIKRKRKRIACNACIFKENQSLLVIYSDSSSKLIGIGNNPMVGMTVAVSIEESAKAGKF